MKKLALLIGMFLTSTLLAAPGLLNEKPTPKPTEAPFFVKPHPRFVKPHPHPDMFRSWP